MAIAHRYVLNSCGAASQPFRPGQTVWLCSFKRPTGGGVPSRVPTDELLQRTIANRTLRGVTTLLFLGGCEVLEVDLLFEQDLLLIGDRPLFADELFVLALGGEIADQDAADDLAVLERDATPLGVGILPLGRIVADRRMAEG